MALRIKKATTERGLIDDVEEMSGVTIKTCLQCKRCANGCPVAEYTTSSPSEIIRQLRMGVGKELLDSEIIWTCVSCATCFSRCPMEINMAEVMDALRIMAVEKRAAKPAGNMPLMNKLLLGTIKSFGRTYDLGAMALYKAGTSSYMKDTEKFPMILKKGKIALLPPRGADKKTVKRIFANIAKAGKK